VAERYAEQFFHELDRKPVDRDILDRYAKTLQGRGTVCDLGCGVGHIARYLHTLGIEMVGLDISPRMIESARRLNPAIPFQLGDILRLELPDSSLAGTVAFYSLIHIARSATPQVLRELRRALIPGGRFLIAVHGGDGDLHVEEFLGQHVSMSATLFQPSEMEACLERAGFNIDAAHVREPYEFELQTQRLHFSATKVA
jgi:SAM-dependent methyltransferase